MRLSPERKKEIRDLIEQDHLDCTFCDERVCLLAEIEWMVRCDALEAKYEPKVVSIQGEEKFEISETTGNIVKRPSPE